MINDNGMTYLVKTAEKSNMTEDLPLDAINKIEEKMSKRPKHG